MNRISVLLLSLTSIVLFAVGAMAQETPSAIELYQSGSEAGAQGDLFTAIEFYQRALELNPSYYEPLYGLALAYYRLGEYDQAQLLLERTRRYGRSRTELDILEAQLNTANGNFPAAEQRYRELLRAEPNHLEALLGEAELLAARAEYGAAIERLMSAIRIEPGNRRALLSLVVLYNLRGEFGSAERYLQAALRFHQQHPDVHLQAAQHYLGRKLIREAEQHAAIAFALRGDKNSLLLLTEVALHQQRYQEAAGFVEQILQLDSGSGSGWYVRGLVYDLLGDRTTSLESFRRALQLDQYAELPRIALEDMMKRRYEPENTIRSDYADWHFQRGDDYLRRNLFQLCAAGVSAGHSARSV